MEFKQSTILFVIFAFSMAVSAENNKNKILSDFMQAHPICPQKQGIYYSNITINYERRCNDCTNRFQMQKNAAGSQTWPERSQLSNKVKTACSVVSCFKPHEQQDKDPKGTISLVLNCLKQKTDISYKIMFDIYAIATKGLHRLNDQYRLIDGRHTRCLGVTKDIYEKSSIESNNHFAKCLSTGTWNLTAIIGDYPSVNMSTRRISN